MAVDKEGQVYIWGTMAGREQTTKYLNSMTLIQDLVRYVVNTVACEQLCVRCQCVRVALCT